MDVTEHVSFGDLSLTVKQFFSPSSCLMETELHSPISTFQEVFELPHKDLSLSSHLGESESPADTAGEKYNANLEHLSEVTCD